MKGLIPSEAAEQQAFVDWLEVRKIPFFAIPNGERRDGRTGAKLKRQGVKAGVPDIFIHVPRGRFHGLFIEMKRREKYSTSKAQTDKMNELEILGYYCAVCPGWDKAKQVSEWYLSGTLKNTETLVNE